MLKKEIPQDQYQDTLRYFFEKDKPLLSKYHVWAGTGLDACVYKTSWDLISHNVKLYGLYQNDKLVAYFGEEHKNNMFYMIGFAIHPEYRNGDTKADFWRDVEAHFGTNFLIGIFGRNDRARAFLEKQGCVRHDFCFTPEGLGEFYMYEVK